MTEHALIDFIHTGQAYTAYLVVLFPMVLAFLLSWLEDLEAFFSPSGEQAEPEPEVASTQAELYVALALASPLPEPEPEPEAGAYLPSPEEQAELYVALALAA